MPLPHLADDPHAAGPSSASHLDTKLSEWKDE